MIKNKIYKIVLCAVVNLMIVSLAIFVFGTRLFQDDDNILSWMTYGIITEASSRTYYTNVILGWIYKHLFSFFPRFNWQTFIFYASMFFSGTFGLYAIIKKNDKTLIFLWLLFEVVFFNDVYVYLTFSVVAAFLACQGYIIIFLTMYESEKRIWMYIVSGMVLAMSSMIRFECFISVSGFAFFVWVILFFNELKEKKEAKYYLKKYVYPFALVISACFFLYFVDRASYLKDGWKEYYDYESVRLVITDENNCANCQDFETLSDLGVTQNQAVAVVDWRNNDPEILTTKLLEIMANTTDQYCYLTSPYVWKTFLGQWKVIFLEHPEIYFILCFLVALICITKKWECLILLVPFLLEIFYLAFIGRVDDGVYPARCVYSITLPFAMGLIILSAYFVKFEQYKKIPFISAFSALLITAIVAQFGKDFSARGLGLVDYDEVCKKYGYLGNNNKTYVCEYAVRTVVEDSFGAWQVPPAGYMDHAIMMGSWLINHPRLIEQQVSLGCENPYRALFEKEDVYYLGVGCSEDSILSYLKENYDTRIYLEYMGDKDEFRVFKFLIEE